MIYQKRNGRHLHRTIAERKLGRKLWPGEVVHHIDGDTQNNHPSNLAVLSSQAEHARLHNTGRKRARATHCKRGHEFSPENTHIYPDGRRRCVQCQRDYDNWWKKAKRRERGLRRPGPKPGVVRTRDNSGRFAPEDDGHVREPESESAA